MVTIKDIAARLNVSASTVGRALADDPRISDGMKKKVAQVAAEIGYVANRAARMMRGASSNLVGLIVPDIRNSFYSTIAHALSKCLEKENLQLMLSETDDDREVELKHVRELLGVDVAGVILVPSVRPHPEAVRLLKATPHIQLLRRYPALGEQWFGIDDTQALHQATKHLVDLGHRRIAYIGGLEEIPTGAARLKGFRSALTEAGAHAAGLEELGPPGDMDFGRQAARRLLAVKKPPTAIVTGAVHHTFSLLDELQDQGIEVPRDLSVVGFGDERGYKWWGPGLTTIGLPVSELATACGLWFVHQLKQKPAAWPAYTSLSPATLIMRGSTAAPGPGSGSSPPEHRARGARVAQR
ncbi:LacI family DNA-binding transcriptional regulator [Ramlibacter sp. WS9]|uniref:LacI family DNA-binding transcriptional regulator n=1 Tax=Ramlibacter sp. WS9 TaxID=1882741 RepID=UPI001141F876|nr:LacI family DNA-binding transcriptional regulator [Ramlibacter sp. WS9]ROZ66056.1 LacI family transcriptional regulator [Ramlibacter sp. WS9]